MSFPSTADVMERFNRAFVERDRHLLDDLVAEDCVMESVQPAPTGERVTGRQACLDWWGALVDDLTSAFEPQEVIVAGDRATIHWHYRYGTGPSDWVSGVNLMRVRDGRIVEALGFSKTAGEVPLATA
ncbi:nuclear transport factor 2 family protein [Nonomuraea sp. NPDC050227]|uniref:nuclear transport factor 2 family protein n=1 Tax=unclassified Nonomuraea TaxID=2593643 RepID=UPI003319CAC9